MWSARKQQCSRGLLTLPFNSVLIIIVTAIFTSHVRAPSMSLLDQVQDYKTSIHPAPNAICTVMVRGAVMVRGTQSWSEVQSGLQKKKHRSRTRHMSNRGHDRLVKAIPYTERTVRQNDYTMCSMAQGKGHNGEDSLHASWYTTAF